MNHNTAEIVSVHNNADIQLVSLNRLKLHYDDPFDEKENIQPEFYEIEEILSERMNGKQLEFLVKWKGFTTRFNSWVKEEDINASQLLNQFRMRLHNEDIVKVNRG